MSRSPRITVRAAELVAVVLTLLGGLLTFAAPHADAAPTPVLNVWLSINNSPTWGDSVVGTMRTSMEHEDGTLTLSRVEANGSLTRLMTTDTEGAFSLPTDPGMPPGTYKLVATAVKAGVEKTSAEQSLTVAKRPTTVTFVNTSSAPEGPLQVRVSAGPGYVPSGAVVFTAPGFTSAVALDRNGDGFLYNQPIGTYQMLAEYGGDEYFATSSVRADVSVDRYRAHPYANLSRETIAAGDPVSLRWGISTGIAPHRPSGNWSLWASRPGGTERELITQGAYSGSGEVTTELTSWAASREGSWSFGLDYAGNQYVQPVANANLGTLSVGPGDQRPTTTTVLDVPTGSVVQGGELTVRVGSSTGTPSGPVVLLTGTNTVVTSGTIVDGVARLTLPASIAPGTHQFRATYGGSAAHQGSTSPTRSVEVTRYRSPTTIRLIAPGAPVPLGGQLQATVRSDDGADVNGPVWLHDGANIIARGDAVDGVATLTLNESAMVGTFELTASFLGNDSYAPSDSEPVAVEIVDPASRAQTVTEIVVPAAGVPVGGELTVAISSASGLPNGTVQLHLDGDDIVYRAGVITAARAAGAGPIATGTAVNGLARIPLPATLGAGVHRFSAVYLGSDRHDRSESEVAAVTVTAPASPPSPGGPGAGGGTPVVTKVASVVTGTTVAKRGKAVLTIAVTATAPVSGTVQIRDGKRLVREVALTDGKARLTLNKLRKGKHRLSVTYLGSATVAGSQRTWTVKVR